MPRSIVLDASKSIVRDSPYFFSGIRPDLKDVSWEVAIRESRKTMLSVYNSDGVLKNKFVRQGNLKSHVDVRIHSVRHVEVVKNMVLSTLTRTGDSCEEEFYMAISSGKI